MSVLIGVRGGVAGRLSRGTGAAAAAAACWWSLITPSSAVSAAVSPLSPSRSDIRIPP